MAAPSTRLRLRVSPGARSNAIVGRYGEGWKVRVTAAPESGKANAAVQQLKEKLAAGLKGKGSGSGAAKVNGSGTGTGTGGGKGDLSGTGSGTNVPSRRNAPSVVSTCRCGWR